MDENITAAVGKVNLSSFPAQFYGLFAWNYSSRASLIAQG